MRCCLVRVTASKGEPKASTAPRLYLAEHQDGLPTQHQIKLAFTDTPVPIEHAVAALLVPGRHRVFTDGTQSAARIRTRTGRAARGPLAETHNSLANSSTLTSRKVKTLTLLTNRAGRYMSQTQASRSSSSK